MRGPQKLLDSEDNWRTRMGAWFPGERVVYRGKDLFEELKDQRWMGLYLYGITGRLFDDKQVELFEKLWTLSTSFPDPRLWNNRVGALAGTTRSTRTLGISAALALSEAKIYGHRANVGAIDFFIRTQKKFENGESLDGIVEYELKKFRGIPGYGRPIISVDERNPPVMRLAESLGFADRPYIKLAFEIENFLQHGRWRMNINITGVAAALAADQGLTPYEYHCYVTPCFLAGIVPCLIDGMDNPEGTLFPINCSRISYHGSARRQWNNQ